MEQVKNKIVKVDENAKALLEVMKGSNETNNNKTK